MVAENDPGVCFDEVAAVLVDFARGGAAVVHGEGGGLDPFGVKTIADCVGTESGGQDITGVEAFAPVKGDGGVGSGSG